MQKSNYNQRPYSSMTVSGVCRVATEPRKYSGEGKNTAVSLSVVFSFRGQSAQGGMQDFSEFYNVQVFGYVADRVLENVSKGDKLIIEGKVIPSSYFSNKTGKEEMQRVIQPTIIAPTLDSKERKGNSGNSGGNYNRNQNNNRGNYNGNNGGQGGQNRQNHQNSNQYETYEDESPYDDSEIVANYADGYTTGDDLLQ